MEDLQIARMSSLLSSVLPNDTGDYWCLKRNIAGSVRGFVSLQYLSPFGIYSTSIFRNIPTSIKISLLFRRSWSNWKKSSHNTFISTVWGAYNAFIYNVLLQGTQGRMPKKRLSHQELNDVDPFRVPKLHYLMQN